MKNIKRFLLTAVLVTVMFQMTGAQGKYLTNNGFISFYSHTIVEDITADNTKVGAVIDSESGEVAIIAEMTEFQFEKKLMQEHFNENYVESHKFPRGTFIGRIVNNSDVDYSRAGVYQVHVEGDMTIHGITRPVSADGTIEVTGDGIVARTKFMLNPQDYDIKIPLVVRDNIANEMEITTELECAPI